MGHSAKKPSPVVKMGYTATKGASFFFSNRVVLPVIELTRDKRTKYTRSRGRGGQKQKKEKRLNTKMEN